MTREQATFCRICEPFCGLIATVDGDRLSSLRPDPEHPTSQGFACPKGIAYQEVQNDPDRVIHPLKRQPGGAAGDAPLAIPGEHLPGSLSTCVFVAWYNGHPDHRNTEIDLSHERAVVIGNGNVARILTLQIGELERTDIAPYALEVLQHRKVREVVVLGRLADVDIVVDGGDIRVEYETVPDGLDRTTRRKLATLNAYADNCFDGSRRIVLRFSPRRSSSSCPKPTAVSSTRTAPWSTAST